MARPAAHEKEQELRTNARVRAARRGASGVRRVSGQLGARAAARYWRTEGSQAERHQRAASNRSDQRRGASKGNGSSGASKGNGSSGASGQQRHQWRPTALAAANSSSCKQGAAEAANRAQREQNKRRQRARARDRATGRRPNGLARPRAEAAGRRPTGRARASRMGEPDLQGRRERSGGGSSRASRTSGGRGRKRGIERLAGGRMG
ncbi:hypothetical protein AXF42_Ash004985 [Apostasia shenzhenica]|uniref:Uncharacterized protein n=1 Tax=Apostasia shenzhenica TaxID=1088818 RepID=A0A2I0B849_9ASPA|nr:hypothetical protein AXF42_Ash004985 [Apostasia shenzhenica]